MILTCPSCGTQYAVKDGAIPEGGRKVRCAACGHSWHQDPEGGDSSPQEHVPEGVQPECYTAEAPAAPAADDVTEPATDSYDTQPSPPNYGGAPNEAAPNDTGPNDIMPDGYDRAEPEPDETERGEIEPEAYEPAEAELSAEPSLAEEPAAVPVPPPGEESWSQPGPDGDQWDLQKEVPDREEIRAVESETRADRKRNWLMAAIIVLVLVAAIVAALWFLAPDSLRQQIGISGPPTPLQIAPGTPERQKLASGNELVMVSGRVINPSGKQQNVPPIQAELRDKAGKLLYSWTIAPPARTLPPGASATFNSAQMDVPPSGLDSTVTLSLKG